MLSLLYPNLTRLRMVDCILRKCKVPLEIMMAVVCQTILLSLPFIRMKRTLAILAQFRVKMIGHGDSGTALCKILMMKISFGDL